MPARVLPGASVQVRLKVRNTGNRAGSEVVQLYINDVQSSVVRPVKELKAFARITLSPGEQQTVELKLDPSAMSYYDVAKKQFVAEPGAFQVLVGSSSREIRLTGNFELAQ